MTFQDLQTALFRRGFEDLNDAGTGLAEAKRLINQGHKTIVRMERWPFRLSTASGASPLTIADLGAVESVSDTAQNQIVLGHRPRQELKVAYSDLTLTGSPRWFYIDNGVIRTYPVGGTLSVLYWKTAATMSANGDLPLVPEDYQEVILAEATRQAHAQRQNWEAVQFERGERDRMLDEMRLDLLDQQDDSSDRIQIVAGSSDW